MKFPSLWSGPPEMVTPLAALTCESIVPLLVSVPLMERVEPAPSSTVPALVTVPPVSNVALASG
jgi:hypothetical protein